MAIVLISVVSVLILVIIVIIIYKFCCSKAKRESKAGLLLDQNSKSYTKDLGDDE